MSPAGAAAALLAAATAAALAWRARALTPRGAVAAAGVGAVVVSGAGWAGGLVLLAFFVSSTLLGRVVRGRTASELDPKGDCRDEWQVLANGGVAALAVAARADPGLALWLATGAFAAAGADTWATIWGTRSGVPPRLITTGRPVPHGTSGGVTTVGTIGGVAGAAFVSLVAAAAGGLPLLVAGTVAGTGGMLADSAAGAALQGRFRCPGCALPSERTVHRCGALTIHTGGIRWLTNDGVNALATLTGAIIAFAGWHWLGS